MAFKSKQELKAQLADAANSIIHKPQRKWRKKVEDLIDVFIDSVYDMSQYIAKTQFDERLVTNKRIQFTILPHAANSTLRNVFQSGSGGTHEFASGEMKLSTGTDASGTITVLSREKGEYVAGAEMECGVGLRLANPLTGSQYIEWGYYDSMNGFGWRHDADGFATIVKRGGVKTYTSQSNWSEDVMDGTTDSAIDLDMTTGSIYLNNFAWYGYGDDIWRIAKTLPNENYRNSEPDIQAVQRVRYHTNGPSVNNPNLPITVEAHNNGTSGNPIELYVGGRQVSILTANPKRATRNLVAVLEDYTVQAGEDVWEPVFALREAPTFQGQNNSINTRFTGLEATADADCRFRVTYDADLSGSTSWSTPPTYNTNESSAQIALTGSIVTGSSGPGFLIPPFGFVEGARNNENQSIEEDVQIPIGDQGGNVVIWAKQTSTTAPVINIAVRWKESF